MRDRKFLRLFAALLALGLIAAACGGGGGEGEGRPGTEEVSEEDIPTGGTLRIAGISDVDYMDPGAMYYTLSWTLARGVVRTLVTYPAVADFEEQNQLVPDLATDVGQSNEDQTQWTYTLKDGVVYGPALGGEDVPGVTGEPITSGDIKYAIERLFIPSVGAGYPNYYEDIVGVEEFQNGDADEITGIETPDDKTIVFNLAKPVGDWDFRMAMPAASPIPRDYVEKFDKKKDSDYDQHVVASGPYYIAEWTPEEQITLERNEHWDPETDDVRKAYVDTVDWKLGLDNDVGVEKILNNDYEFGMDVAPSGPALERVVNTPELKQRLINEPSLCTRYVWLNTTVEPFNDPLVRQAVNFAIDRANIKRVFGGPITGPIATSVVPPGMTGHLAPEEYNPFETPNMAGDMERAKELMAEAGYENGYDGKVLFVGASDPPHDKIAETVRSDLEELGFTNLDVKTPAFPNQYTQFYSVPSKNVGIGTSAGWCKDYNDAFTFLDPLFHGRNIRDSGNYNYSELDDERLNEAIDRAAGLTGDDRIEAWEEANRLATESAVWVPWSWDNETIIFSENLVNPIYNTFFSHIDWVVVGVEQGAGSN
ncbi:MAG TPA: ABC transporter substrate-binding protein [Actinomycetota bacterium]|nr:ABC transporter substrate-binding protein [Actinomycetota bacterium]